MPKTSNKTKIKTLLLIILTKKTLQMENKVNDRQKKQLVDIYILFKIKKIKKCKIY
jgi:hypothetical protein